MIYYKLLLIVINLWMAKPPVESVSYIQELKPVRGIQIELDGDSLRQYYISYEYKRNGRFNTWETEKVYIEDDK